MFIFSTNIEECLRLRSNGMAASSRPRADIVNGREVSNLPVQARRASLPNQKLESSPKDSPAARLVYYDGNVVD